MTVFIGQASANLSHSHGITDPGHTHAVATGSNTTYSGDLVYEIGTYKDNFKTTSATTGITINSNGETESRPNNITVKIWERTA